MSQTVLFEPTIRFGVGSSNWEITGVTIQGRKAHLNLAYEQFDPIVRKYEKPTGTKEWAVPEFVDHVLDQQLGQSYAWVDTTAVDAVARVTRAIESLIFNRNERDN